MAQPFGIAEIPPNDIWDLYIWLLFIPGILRLMLLAGPFVRVSKQLSPHGGWIWKRLKELPVKGYTLLAVNEILAFSLPILLAIGVRLLVDPLGWNSWEETNWLGFFLLLILGFLWVFVDTIRIIKVRTMLKTIEKQNIERLRKIADKGFKLREILRKFARKDSKEQEEEPVVKSVAKTSLFTWGAMALKARKLTPAGLLGSVATGAAVELSRRGAGVVSDKIDEKMQKEFEKISVSNSKTVMQSFARDLVMALAPLIALWLIPTLLP
ncbi:MAG: hypothetical protein CMA91_01645 [Euryarchaeota archaeon]|nr:hypothetical protein [Euryarchaeota archaeon]